MFTIRFNTMILLVTFSFLLAACSNSAAVVGVEQSGEGGEVGPQEIVGATEVVKFDPASIPPGDADPISGVCVGSSVVPGTYRCDLGMGNAAEPCFALGGTRLLCDPDPAAGTYTSLVSPSNALPSVAPPPPDRTIPFFVELDDGMTCAIRTAPESVILGGVTAQYDCDTPYTFILGFEKSAPAWEAAVFTLDPATGESPSGKVPVDVRRVWVP